MGLPLQREAQRIPGNVEPLFTELVQTRLLYHTKMVWTL
jgi:hypothetical protein